MGECGTGADMKSLDLKSFYAQSLCIPAPWNVTDVVFDGEHKVVTIFVEWASRVAWADAPPVSENEVISINCQKPKREVHTFRRNV